MNTTDKTILEKFTKELSTLHYALTFFAFLTAALIYFFVIKDAQIYLSDTESIFIYICPLLAIGSIIGGSLMYRNKVEEIKKMDGLETKLAAYRIAMIQRFSFIEMAALLGIIASMQTRNLLYIIIALVLILFLFSLKVNQQKIIEELGLG